MTIFHTASRGAAIHVDAVTTLIAAGSSARGERLGLFPLGERVFDGAVE